MTALSLIVIFQHEINATQYVFPLLQSHPFILHLLYKQLSLLKVRPIVSAFISMCTFIINHILMMLLTIST